MGLWTPRVPGAQVLGQLTVLVLPMLPSGEGVLEHWKMYREGISMEKGGNKKTLTP